MATARAPQSANPGRRHPPTLVDQHVAARVKERRRELKLTVIELGDLLGVSEQQVRKYETRKDRITVGRLYTLSLALDVPITYFFEKLSPEAMKDLSPSLLAALAARAKKQRKTP